MTLERLHCFMEVAEQLNFTRAAQTCHIAQTAMSRQIAMLEEEVGCRLFERDNRAVSLTAAGRIFYDGVAILLRQYQDTLEQTRKIGRSVTGGLRIGIGQYERSFVSELVKEFHQIYPLVDVSVAQYTYQELVTKLLAGALDIIFALPISAEYLADQSVEMIELFTSETDIVVRRDHPCAGMEVFPAERLYQECVLTISEDEGPCSLRIFYQKTMKNGILLKHVQQANSLEALLLMVEAGIGVAHVPHFLERDLSDKLVLLRQTSYPPGKFVAILQRDNQNQLVRLFADGIHTSHTLWDRLEQSEQR